MATNNEIYVVYVNEDKSLDTIRINATQCAVLADKRPIILATFRRPNTSGPGHFEDEYYGWPCYDFKRYRAKAGGQDGHTVTRCRPKKGPESEDARDVHYDDDESPGSQRTWPSGLYQASVGGSGVTLLSYDLEASDYDTILAQARALDPDDTPLTPSGQ